MSINKLEPDILKFEVGGYRADSCKLEWNNGKLFFDQVYPLKVFDDSPINQPDEKRWKEFWAEMENIDVWDWASEYTALVVDGTSWSLNLKLRNKHINSRGHMAYPDPKNLSKTVELEVTSPFRRLVQSLNKLCGNDIIPAQ